MLGYATRILQVHYMQQRPSLVQIRRQRDRFASSYQEAAVLPNEVAERLLERLDYVRLSPAVILDLGAAAGITTRALAERYPQAQVFAADLSWALLKQQFPSENLHLLTGELERLPFANATVDLVVANLSLAWLADPQFCFQELNRILCSGGLLLFSSLGPDTFKELRSAFSNLDCYDHVAEFIDMHHLGDALLATGWEDPVMDMEMLTLSYEDLADLFQDLRVLGAKNLLNSRCPHLMPSSIWKKMQEQYGAQCLANHYLPATFEIIYGHAWKPQARELTGANEQNEVLISVDSIKRKGA